MHPHPPIFATVLLTLKSDFHCFNAHQITIVANKILSLPFFFTIACNYHVLQIDFCSFFAHRTQHFRPSAHDFRPFCLRLFIWQAPGDVTAGWC
jgi:hypothetical protein